jgi:hypothetical protein
MTNSSYAGGVVYKWLPGRFAILLDVEPPEVLEVLDDTARRWPRRHVGPGGLPLLAIFGRTKLGRGLIVYLRHDEGFDWTIVGGREMTPAESTEYDKWEAQQ